MTSLRIMVVGFNQILTFDQLVSNFTHIAFDLCGCMQTKRAIYDLAACLEAQQMPRPLYQTWTSEKAHQVA